MVWDVWSRCKKVINGAGSLEALTKRKNYHQFRGSGLRHKVENGRLVRHRYDVFADVDVVQKRRIDANNCQLKSDKSGSSV